MVKISIIVPALNEGKYIKNMLESLSRQSFNDFEVIVVDGGSSDGTCKVAQNYAKIVKQRRKGVSAARNIGASHAKGEILFFTDADTIIDKGTLRSISELFKDESIAVATGPILPKENVSLAIRIIYALNYRSLVKFSMLIGKPSFIGSNIAIRRSTFMRIHGFNRSYNTYEDCDMTIRAGREGRAVYDNGIKVYSSARRIVKWGIAKYLAFTVPNMLNFYFRSSPSKNYEPIR